jgi:hypothetical protein
MPLGGVVGDAMESDVDGRMQPHEAVELPPKKRSIRADDAARDRDDGAPALRITSAARHQRESGPGCRDVSPTRHGLGSCDRRNCTARFVRFQSWMSELDP